MTETPSDTKCQKLPRIQNRQKLLRMQNRQKLLRMQIRQKTPSGANSTETPLDANLTGITLGCHFSDSAKNASAQAWTEKWFGFLLRISAGKVQNSPSDFSLRLNQKQLGRDLDSQKWFRQASDEDKNGSEGSFMTRQKSESMGTRLTLSFRI